MESIKRKLPVFIGILIVGVILFCCVLLLKVPFIASAMDGPKFCGSCHSMDAEVASYLDSPHAGVATCSDCHIPHATVSGSYYKAYTGSKDVLYTFLGKTENIEIGETGKQIVQNNCIACHSEALSEVGNTMLTNDRYCYECHASVRHLNK